MHTAHQVVRDLHGAVLRLLRDVLRATHERAARAEGVQPNTRGGEDEPSRGDASLTIASPLGRVGHVRESFREVDQTLGKLVDIGHLDPSLSFSDEHLSFPR